VLVSRDLLGVDRWVFSVLFSSDGKTWVLEFNREGERGQRERESLWGYRKYRMILSV
jgi:hypothetical protein